jgi:hypothetical protein
MAFPTSQVDTTNLDDATDDPNLARVDLLDAVTKLNTIIDEAGDANGICLLDSNGRIQSSQVPAIFSPTTNLTLSPSTNIVNIQDIVRLTAQPKADVLAISTATLTMGDIAVVSNAGGSLPTIAFYTGSAWKYINTSTWATLT